MSVILTSSQISKKLKIGKSLVREISKQLEKDSYQFTKNKEARIYSEKDIILIQAIVEDFHQNQNQTLLHSVQSVLAQMNASKLQVDVTVDVQDTNLSQNQLDEISVTPNQLIIGQPTTKDYIPYTSELDFDDVEEIFVEEDDEVEARSEIIELQVDVETHSEMIELQVDVETHSEMIELQVDIEAYSEIIEQQVVVETHSEIIELQADDEAYSEIIEQQVDVETHSVLEELNIEKDRVDAVTNQDLHIVSSSIQSGPNQLMFEDFMSQITNLANQNEKILMQNQTLIKQNLVKDQKLEKILNSVEEKSEELQELASVIEEKDEKLEQMFEEIQIREVGRDAQLMRVIREMQETKKMVAASKEKDWKNSLKSFFIKPKTIK